nr:hypothetical protein [Tanacetum cinerariifolium]
MVPLESLLPTHLSSCHVGTRHDLLDGLVRDKKPPRVVPPIEAALVAVTVGGPGDIDHPTYLLFSSLTGCCNC